MTLPESIRQLLKLGGFCIFILSFLSALTASGEDAQIRIKSLYISEVHEDGFKIKGEIINKTNEELKRTVIKFKAIDSEGKVIAEFQILPFVKPIPPGGESQFVIPIEYFRGMEKLTFHVIKFGGEVFIVDPGYYSLEVKVPASLGLDH
jgi:hypothetical protein